ncbi:CATRA system-associated protein [Nonomuraea sp. NPDC049152]|uniref:CATRA system-associated protein n=1 Tax=Nonomuraea sp. NPDC049152 TaxID=3154350 RepID=UPI0033E90DBE
MNRVSMVTTLRAIAGYRLSEARWARVDRALTAMEEALQAGARDRVTRAVQDLALIGPVRISTRYGDPPRVPASEETRERLNRLIFTLSEEEPAEDG